MYDLELEIRWKCSTWCKKLDRNVHHGVRNMIEMYDLHKKLDQNVRLGVRN